MFQQRRAGREGGIKMEIRRKGAKKMTDRKKETIFDNLLITEWRIYSSLAYVYALRPPVDAPTLGYY